MRALFPLPMGSNRLRKDRNVFIVDAQVHIWGHNTPERPWLAKPHREPPMETDELLREMDAAGVARAILVPPSHDGMRNDLVLDAARRYPDRFAAMGRLDTKAPGARDLISSWCKQPGMMGMRFSFNRDLGPVFAEGRLEWVWEEAEKAGVPIMALVPHPMMPLMDRVAERHPGLKIALCHFGLPTDKQDEEAFRNFDKLLPLSKRPNVCVKASALPTYTSDNYPFRRVHPYLRRAYDAFGPRRMFWGSDLSRLNCSYRQAITMFTEEIPWFSAEDKEWVMGRGLCEWLGWKLPRS